MKTFREKTAERVKATGRRAYRPSNGTEGDRCGMKRTHRKNCPNQMPHDPA